MPPEGDPSPLCGRKLPLDKNEVCVSEKRDIVEKIIENMTKKLVFPILEKLQKTKKPAEINCFYLLMRLKQFISASQ